jgi:hypothetical protein
MVPHLSEWSGVLFKTNFMVLEVSKRVKETVEIATPSFYRYSDMYYHITDRAVLKVFADQITLWSKDSSGVYIDRVAEAINGKEITREEFENKYDEVVTSFKMLLCKGEVV